VTEEEEFEFRHRLEKEKSGGSSPLPANAGLANFAASTLGAPVDIIQGVINAPKMIYGAAATALGRPDLAPEVSGDAFGGSQSIKRGLRATGLPGLSPDNPTPLSDMGTAQYDLASRGGFLPGGFLPAAGSMIAEKIAGPEWAGVGALTPSAAISGYNRLREPSLRAAEARNQVRDATLREAQDKGYVLPPSQVNPTAVGNAVESFAGKAALKQEAELKNQQVTNRLVREELNIPANTPITDGLLDTLRTKAAEPYRQIAAMSKSAETALQRLRDVRAEAKDQWMYWDRQAVPEAKRQAIALDKKAEMLESFIEKQATFLGKPELVKELREARTYIAKTYDVDRALNIGNGDVNAKIIGRALDRGRPLTGNFEVIGKFAEGPGKQFTREAAAVPTPGVSALNLPAAAILGIEGAQHFGPQGAALAAIPFVRGGVRQGVLSDVYQGKFARPDYTAAMNPENGIQSLAALLARASQQ